ncbi:MAG: hypothetical protein R2867_33895 [Caldilineaceae bacterium]
MPALQLASARFQDYVQSCWRGSRRRIPPLSSALSMRGVTFPIPLDSDFTAGQLYNVQGMPTTFLLTATLSAICGLAR